MIALPSHHADSREDRPPRSDCGSPTEPRFEITNSSSGVTLVEAVDMVLASIPQVKNRHMNLACVVQLRNKWAYRVKIQDPPLPRKRLPHPTTGATRDFSALPKDIADEFMPVWVVWALQNIQNLRADVDAALEALAHLDAAVVEAVADEAVADDEDP